MRTLPESADSDYEVEMTHSCEKLFKKLPRHEQEAVNERIKEIKKEPTCGDYFRDPALKGLLHTHVRGSSSNLLIAWSKVDTPKKKIIIEGVGSHQMPIWLASHRK